MNALLIIVAILLFIYGPLGAVKAAGYLVQKYKFGNSFKEVYAHHKEQDALERAHRAKENN
jgi:hypothetical protein